MRASRFAGMWDRALVAPADAGRRRRARRRQADRRIRQCRPGHEAGLRATASTGATGARLFGVALLCGIGFTMSLFIGLLAFAGNPILQDEVKLGILVGSLVAALAGAAVLLVSQRENKA